MTLEECVTFIDAKETGRRAASQLATTPSQPALAGANAVSSYKQAARTDPKSQSQQQAPGRSAQNAHKQCYYCGNSDHNGDKRSRKLKCPAWNVKCKNCGLMRHFEKMC